MRRKYSISKAAKEEHRQALLNIFRWVFALAMAGWLIGLLQKLAG